MTQLHIVTLPFATMVVGACLLLFCVLLSWDLYLNLHEHDPDQIRRVMGLALVLVMAADTALALHGVTKLWMGWLTVALDLWGGLDAVLRYPACHHLTSFFSLKQFACLAIKSCVYPIGMASFRRDASTVFVIVLFTICSLPLLYLMALPMDRNEQCLNDDTYDIDLARRVWHMAVRPVERRQSIAICRTWWNRHLVDATESSPFVRVAICAASPAYRRTFKRAGRSV